MFCSNGQVNTAKKGLFYCRHEPSHPRQRSRWSRSLRRWIIGLAGRWSRGGADKGFGAAEGGSCPTWAVRSEMGAEGTTNQRRQKGFSKIAVAESVITEQGTFRSLLLQRHRHTLFVVRCAPSLCQRHYSLLPSSFSCRDPFVLLPRTHSALLVACLYSVRSAPYSASIHSPSPPLARPSDARASPESARLLFSASPNPSQETPQLRRLSYLTRSPATTVRSSLPTPFASVSVCRRLQRHPSTEQLLLLASPRVVRCESCSCLLLAPASLAASRSPRSLRPPWILPANLRLRRSASPLPLNPLSTSSPYSSNTVGWPT